MTLRFSNNVGRKDYAVNHGYNIVYGFYVLQSTECLSNFPEICRSFIQFTYADKH